MVAALKNEGDLAIGNAIGSCIFNIFGILGAAALLRPIQAARLSVVDLWVMIASAILIFPLMRSGFCLNRWERVLLMLGYIIYIYHLLP